MSRRRKWAVQKVGPVAFDPYRDTIEEKLIGDQVDKQMSAWLENARQRSEVVVHEEAFQ